MWGSAVWEEGREREREREKLENMGRLGMCTHVVRSSHFLARYPQIKK